MFIIQIEPLDGTSFHPFQSQSHRRECWLEGYVEVPEHLIAAVMDSGGWCELTLNDDVLTEARLAARPEPASEPTPDEDRDAMLVDLMTEVALLKLGIYEM